MPVILLPPPVAIRPPLRVQPRIAIEPRISTFYARFYFFPNQLPAVSPDRDANFESGNPARRRRMAPVRGNTGSAVFSEEVVLPPGSLCLVQCISNPITVDETVAGTAKVQSRAEKVGVGTIFSRMTLKIVSADGLTVRGTLLAFADYSTGAEWASPVRNKTFADGDALTSVNALAGDRLMLELGFRAAVNTSPQDLYIQDDSGTDLPEDETTTTADNPWLEIFAAVPVTSLLPPEASRLFWLPHFTRNE